jgi:uncharacterized membrane protein YoaK (UPF0700 family)
VWGGAFVLALVAGCVNVTCILAARQTVSHMTGNNSEAAIQVVHGDMGQALALAGVIGSFLAGAVVSGYIVRDNTLKLGRRYGVALFIETIVLLCAMILLRKKQMIGINLAALACGLQNAMVSTYSGAIIRTTHLTGIFTDLGVLIGQRLGGLPVDGRRVKLFLLIIAGFVCGGMVGAAGFELFGVNILLLPVTLTAGAAVCYAWLRRRSALS